jgi:hypothetical protein
VQANPDGQAGPGTPSYDRRAAEALDRLDDARDVLRRHRRRWLIIGAILAVSFVLFFIAVAIGPNGGAVGGPAVIGFLVGLLAALVRFVMDRRVPHPRHELLAAERHHRNVTLGWD